MENILEQCRRASVDRLRPAPSYTHPVTFHYEIQNHTTRMQKLTKAFKVYRLTVLTLICVVVGLGIGLLCRPHAKNWTERQFMYIEMPGELYFRFLKLMIIPLLVSNVILSFGTIQGKLLSHLGKIASFLYLGSNVMAVTVAIVLALIMCPGRQTATTVDNQIETLNIDTLNPSIREYQDDRSTLDSRTIDYQQPSEQTYLVQSVTDPAVFIFQSRVWDLPDEGRVEISGERIIYPFNTETHNQTPTNRRVKKTNNDTLNHQIHRTALSSKLPIDVLLDVLRNLVPDSIIGATMQQSRTRLLAPKELIVSKNGSTNPPPSQWPLVHEMTNQANIIGLLAMSVLTGIVLSHMDEAHKPMLDLCACVAELSLRVGLIAINLTPFCIMFLLIGQVARAHDLSLVAGELCMYTVTCIIALIIHGFVLLPLAYYAITKKSPLDFLVSMLEALVTAFATSSSSATMAQMLSCLGKLDLNPVIVRAFGPLGSVFNMNGTAIYEAIGAIFIAQTFGVTLPLTSLLLVGLSAAIASLSTTGIPSSGMMTMVIVLNSVNLPVLRLSLIYIVDFIIDRFRTVINVWSAAIVCGIIDHICPEHLFEEEMKPEKYREMVRYRASRGSLGGRKCSHGEEINPKPQVISVTITPPLESSCV